MDDHPAAIFYSLQPRRHRVLPPPPAEADVGDLFPTLPADEPAKKKAPAPTPEADGSGKLSKKARSWLRRDNAKLGVDELIAKSTDMFRAGENIHALVAAVAALKSVPKAQTSQRARIHLLLCQALMVGDRTRVLEQLEQAIEAAADSSRLAPLYAQLRKGPGRRLKARLEARAAE